MGRKLNIIKITPEAQKQYDEIAKKAKDLTDKEMRKITAGLYEHFDKDFYQICKDIQIEALRKKLRKSKPPKCLRLTLWQKIKYSKIWNYIKNVIRMFN